MTLPAWTRGGAGPLLCIGAFVFVVAIGNADGGYFPTAWGWAALAFAWIAGVAWVAADRVALGRFEQAFLALLTLVVAWTALSIAWSSDVEQSVLEVQRALVYLLGVSAVLLVVRGSSVGHLLGGVVAGIVWLSAYGLATRLFPDAGPALEELTLSRLDEPIGYWNALGLFAVLGVLLALGFAVHGRHLIGRVAAAAALPILTTTLYFTYSRGAAVALGVGLVAAVALERRRRELVTIGLLLAAPSAVAVWLASRSSALTSDSAPRALIEEEGAELALIVAACVVVSALVAWLVTLVGPRLALPRSARRLHAAVLAGALLALVAVPVVHEGGPGPLVRDAWDRFNEDASSRAAGDGGDLNRRLGRLGSGERVDVWRVARDAFEERPLAGSGAGTFQQHWLRDRDEPIPTRDGHSLYLETLSDLGLPGLLLVLAMLAIPLAAAVRARGQPLMIGAFGAYVAYLVHAGIDWDWEVPVVTLIALTCGAALLAAQQGAVSDRLALSGRGRALGLAATVAVAAFAVIGLVGNRALADAAQDVDAGRFDAAVKDARTAIDWAPWSAEAHRQLGRAQVARGEQRRGRKQLREATRKSPDDWRAWYDLGISSTGRQRQSALVAAAQLNPLEDDISALRDLGYRLPLASVSE